MKNPGIVLVLLFTVASISGYSQLKKKMYSIQLENKQGDRLKGWIIALHDSAIQVWIPGKHSVDTLIAIKNIQRLSVRRKNGPGRGLRYGLLVGGGIGTLLGYASYSPPGCDGFCIDFGPGLSAVVGAVAGALTGSIVGALGGSTYRNYMIYGDQPSYDAFKAKILNGPKSTMEKPIIIRKETTHHSPLTTHPNIPQTVLSTARVFRGLSTPPDRGGFP
jgi:hypothetical protein